MGFHLNSIRLIPADGLPASPAKRCEICHFDDGRTRGDDHLVAIGPGRCSHPQRLAAPKNWWPAPTDRFLKAGSEMLSKSKTAQFFDRDTTPEMAKAAMQLMVEFMLDTDSMMDILEEMEEERSRIFGG